MEDEQEQKTSFKFKDNRRFDSEGNERNVGTVPVTAEKPVEKAAKPLTPEAQKAETRTAPSAQTAIPIDDALDDDGQEEGIDFSSFIVSLGTQALMQLGLVKSPDGVAMPTDKAAAKQTIDIIGMLEARTKGNLTPDEIKLVTEVLHSLRLGFIKAQS